MWNCPPARWTVPRSWVEAIEGALPPLRARIAPATAAHIHEAPPGAPGPVVQGLIAPTRGRSAGCLTNYALAADIAADPGDYYVNVHNTPFPGGAVRGQL
ncbi:MAG: CHRD domain-containing protein [Acidimicrobiia bacterium]|nr:CHRD domain-containing protein [Acidimicrobiia bacterium]